MAWFIKAQLVELYLMGRMEKQTILMEMNT